MTYDKLITDLHATFPEFKNELTDEIFKISSDNPSVHFSYFANYCYKNLNDVIFKAKLRDFLNQMSDSVDEDVKHIQSDFLLDFYCTMKEKGKKTDDFVNSLSQATQQTYFLNIDFWEKGKKT